MTYVLSQGAERERILLCVRWQSSKSSGKRSALGLGDGGSVAVVDVENVCIVAAQLLNLGAVPLVVHVLGSAEVSYRNKTEKNLPFNIPQKNI